jgi:hypothetical protein
MSGRKAGWGRDLVDRVGNALRETSAEVIESRFAARRSTCLLILHPPEDKAAKSAPLACDSR